MNAQTIIGIWINEICRLSQSRHGRVLLHLGCALRRPSHLSWHWHGILRELPGAASVAR